MFAQFFVILGIVINGISVVIYDIATIKGEIKPNKITFLLWSLAPFVAFLAEIKQGVGIQSLMTVSVALFPFSTFACAFFNKNAYWKIQKFDLVCGGLSLLGLILWYITHVGNIAIALSIIADALAALPTVVKAYQHPETEAPLPWLGAVASGILTLITVRTWNFQTIGFPLYYTVIMATIFLFSFTKMGAQKNI